MQSFQKLEARLGLDFLGAKSIVFVSFSEKNRFPKKKQKFVISEICYFQWQR